MAQKRGDKSKYELINLGFNQRKDEFIERLILPTDSLQGIALLYNTSVSELKKVNHIHTDFELHARRVIKVPAKGILVDLTEETAVPSSSTINVQSFYDESDEEKEQLNGQSYLNNKDTVLKEIREKADAVAASSPILNGSDTSTLISSTRSSKSELKWWMIFIPCIGLLIMVPIFYFLYRKELEHIQHPDLFLNETHNNLTLKSAS